jgi:hypothetical protein
MRTGSGDGENPDRGADDICGGLLAKKHFANSEFCNR